MSTVSKEKPFIADFIGQLGPNGIKLRQECLMVCYVYTPEEIVPDGNYLVEVIYHTYRNSDRIITAFASVFFKGEHRRMSIELVFLDDSHHRHLFKSDSDHIAAAASLNVLKDKMLVVRNGYAIEAKVVN